MEKWIVNRDQCTYTSCYWYKDRTFKYVVIMTSLFSEENIWKLCECWEENDPNHLSSIYAVFISNERRQIPVWEQKSNPNKDRPVIWV